RANGRGAYVCRDAACISTATGRGALSRALAAPIPPSLATELQAQLPLATPTTHPDPMIAGGTLGQE
ncbi:MAG TPA: YlxR family protein, partial [Candidatus Binatus sp.]|nr:YlxR family protein [Candidatus Binatus sp.]